MKKKGFILQEKYDQLHEGFERYKSTLVTRKQLRRELKKLKDEILNRLKELLIRKTETAMSEYSDSVPPQWLSLKGHRKAKASIAYAVLSHLIRYRGHTLDEIAQWPDKMILRQRNIGIKILPYFKEILQWKLKNK